MSFQGEFLDFDALLKPIPGDNPSGKDLRYTAVYDDIENARKADDTLERGKWQRELKTADWRKVIAIATDALTQKTKDIFLAVRLSEALASAAGFAGLRESLTLIRALLEQFWDTLYPEIEDGDLEYRSGPLNLMNEKLPLLIKQIPITENRNNGVFDFFDLDKAREIEQLKKSARKEDQAALAAYHEEEKKLDEYIVKAIHATDRSFYESLLEALNLCSEEISKLEEVADEKFGKDAPGFTALKKVFGQCREEIARILKDKPKPEPAPEMIETGEPFAWGEAARVNAQDAAAVETPEGTASVPGPSANEPAPAIIKGDSPPASAAPSVKESGDSSPAAARLPRNREEALARLIEATACLRSFAPESPISYLVLRALRWGELRENGTDLSASHLSAPPSEIRQKLKELHEEQRWPELMEESEKTLAQLPGGGWLDLQRYALIAMERAGSGFVNAAAAIRSALATHLTDYGKLPELELSDGTPAANSQTREWLAREIFAPAPRNNAANVPAAGEKCPEEAPTEDIYERALGYSKSGQFPRGLLLLQDLLGGARCERDRYQARLRIVELCLEANKADLARPILQELLSLNEKFRLEEWEIKEFNVRIWKAAYHCFRDAANRTGNHKEQTEQAFNKLCQLDAGQALTLADQ